MLNFRDSLANFKKVIELENIPEKLHHYTEIVALDDETYWDEKPTRKLPMC